MNKPKTKTGIIKFIAKTGAKGIKFADDDFSWYNPTNKIRDSIIPELKGAKVTITLTGNKNEFSDIIVANTDKSTTKKEIKEEKVVLKNLDNPEPQKKVERIPEARKTIDKENEEYDIEYTQDVYRALLSTKLETAKKGPHNLTYASWAEAWGALKSKHPIARYKVHENKEGMPVFYSEKNDKMGAFVKVTVSIMNIPHTVHLPVMDYSNKSIAVSAITTFDINKAIQRALTKAIAMHGIGLYVYRGEDYPEK